MKLFLILGWIYSIGKILNKNLGKQKINNYNEDLFILIYIISIFGIIQKTNAWINSLVISGILLFISAILGFYTLLKLINFSAKVLKTKELGRNVKFEDYSSDFFLILFFIIGVWIIQPRLNRLID